MSTTIYLKFPDQATYDALGGFQDADVRGNLSTPEYTDEEGNVTPAHVVEGWHVNWPACRDLPEELKPFVIPEPDNPKCRFA